MQVNFMHIRKPEKGKLDVVFTLITLTVKRSYQIAKGAAAAEAFLATFGSNELLLCCKRRSTCSRLWLEIRRASNDKISSFTPRLARKLFILKHGIHSINIKSYGNDSLNPNETLITLSERKKIAKGSLSHPVSRCV